MSSFQDMRIRVINKPGQFMPTKKHIFIYHDWEVDVPALKFYYTWDEVYAFFKLKYGDKFPLREQVSLEGNVTFSEEMVYD